MWPNPQFPADLVTFTREILSGKRFCEACGLPLNSAYYNKVTFQAKCSYQIYQQSNACSKSTVEKLEN